MSVMYTIKQMPHNVMQCCMSHVSKECDVMNSI